MKNIQDAIRRLSDGKELIDSDMEYTDDVNGKNNLRRLSGRYGGAITALNRIIKSVEECDIGHIVTNVIDFSSNIATLEDFLDGDKKYLSNEAYSKNKWLLTDIERVWDIEDEWFNAFKGCDCKRTKKIP